MFPWSPLAEKYSLVPGRGVVVFDPATLMIGSMAATAAGTGLSAMSTLAGGKGQQTEANYEAAQIRENAAGEIGASQRRMLDTQQRTRLAMSTLRANAAGGGVDAGVGTPVADAASIARRGSYQSMMDLFNGQNAYTGDLNRAAGVTYSGDIARQASQLAAAGTIAGGAGKMISTYSNYTYPRYGGGGYG